jgi:pimeloyl-ACP methyl ester carboxylesterase
MQERTIRSWDGTELCCIDFGGDGPPVLLLHGLCGRGVEWRETASWLTSTHRVLALDQRAHGRSAKGVGDLSPAAFVNDAAATIESLAREPAIVIGQSMGGAVAYRLAATRPDLIRALVVVEAQAWDDRDAPRPSIDAWLRSWPIPFASLADARSWLRSQGLVADVWCDVLEFRCDGWYPGFRLDDMLAIVAQPTRQEQALWRTIVAPVLVVRGERSTITSGAIVEAMARALPKGRFVSVSGAGHDLHLERPAEWRAALTAFLDDLAHE